MEEVEVEVDEEDHHKERIFYSHLPEDVVEEILVRLPVKSLLRFKAVSKPWYALISDPRFAKSNLDLATTNGNNNREDGDKFSLGLERLGLLCFEDSHRPCMCRITSKYFTDVATLKVRKQLPNNPFNKDPSLFFRKEIQFLGSCDGLLFVTVTSSDQNQKFLWNPCTGETKTISSSRSEFSSFLSLYIEHDRVSGLGYDDDYYNYKTVIAFRTNPPSVRPKFGVPEPIAVSVCNAKSGVSSMKYYNDFPYTFYMTNQAITAGVTVNGTPHWTVSRLNKDYRSNFVLENNKAIICFDMVEESFKEVSHPDSFTKSSYFNVAVLGGLLCVVDSSKKHIRVDVWAMKEYGVKESWTKLFALRSYLNPLVFINNAEVLIHGNNLMTSNIQTGKEEDHKLYSRHHTFYTVAYMESLVSPNGHGVVQMPSLMGEEHL